MATTLETIRLMKPQIERWRFWRTWLGMMLRGIFGIGRRYGVRFDSGNGEMTGFYYRGEALNWLTENGLRGEVFHYEPIDTWLPGKERRVRYSGAPTGS